MRRNNREALSKFDISASDVSMVYGQYTNSTLSAGNSTASAGPPPATY